MLLALCAGSLAASAPPPAKRRRVDRGSGRAIHPRRQHSPAAAWRHGARLQSAGRHMCRLRRLFDRARRADAHRPRGQEGERLGVQGKQQDHHRLWGAAGELSARKTEAIAPGTIRETPEGWCVQTAALARWFGIGVKPVTSGSVLRAAVGGEAAGRAGDGAAAARGAVFTAPASILQALPQVRRPLSHVAGARARLRRQRRSSPIAPTTGSGSIARARSMPPAKSRTCPMTRRSRRPTTGKPSLLRLRAFRSDPDGQAARPAQGHARRLRRCRGIRQPPDRLRVSRPRRGHHQSAADRPHSIRPDPHRGRPAGRLGSGDLSQRRAARLCQVGWFAALCL